MILLILGFIFLICSLILFYKANQIKINKNKEQENYEQLLNKQIYQLEQERETLINSQIHKKEEINQDLLEWQEYRKKEIEAYIESQKQLADQTINTVYESAQKQISDINNDIQNTRNTALQEKEQIQTEIDKLKASLSAGVEARLREQEKKDKINFYKLSISEADLADVKMLQNLKSSFHKPVVLSKLIWTQYFQKQMTQLCDRVFGKKPISGIYKITDLITEECYIGQSVNIQQRMKKDKVWNFSFELLEQCSKESLNEKEKFWIQMYQSNKFGLNTMKGNS